MLRHCPKIAIGAARQLPTAIFTAAVSSIVCTDSPSARRSRLSVPWVHACPKHPCRMFRSQLANCAIIHRWFSVSLPTCLDLDFSWRRM